MGAAAVAGQTIGLDAIPFHVHWDVVGVVVAIVAAYLYGIRVLGPRHAPQTEPAVSARQVAYFTSGLVLFVAVRSWPIHDIGESSLFTFHMIEHMVLALGVPPLLLKGVPWWLLRLAVLPILPAVRFLTRPIIALVAFNATLALLHWDEVVALMLRSEGAHFGLHAALLVTATLMWWPVIGPIPDLPKLSPFLGMGYLFLQSLVPTIPASFLTFATAPVYHSYVDLPRLWGLSVLDDQLIAGLIMKLGGGAVLWIAITVIFFSWAAEEERAKGPPRYTSVPG